MAGHLPGRAGLQGRPASGRTLVSKLTSDYRAMAFRACSQHPCARYSFDVIVTQETLTGFVDLFFFIHNWYTVRQQGWAILLDTM